MTTLTNWLRAAVCGAIAIVVLVQPQRVLATQQTQQPAPAPAAAPAPAPAPVPTAAQRAAGRAGAIPLEVDVVIARYLADKKISSLPYILTVNAMPGGPGPETQLNMGSDVAISNNPVPAGDPGAVRSYNYRPIGTSISLRATVLDDGRFELVLSIDDSSVASAADRSSATPAVLDMPVMRNFKTRNTLLLRDGQQRQFTAATDRVSGEVVKIDVTARALK